MKQKNRLHRKPKIEKQKHIAQPVSVEQKKTVTATKVNLIWIVIISFLCTVTIIWIVRSVYINFFSPFLRNHSRNADLLKRFVFRENHLVDPFMVVNLIEKSDDSWLFIDYRSAKEYQASHIKGAINIPLYTSYEKFLDTTLTFSEWYKNYRTSKTKAKYVLLYGYWSNSKLTSDLMAYLQRKRQNVFGLKIGFYEFKNRYADWMPGGDMVESGVGKYLEGKMIEPLPFFDGVPPLPGPK